MFVIGSSLIRPTIAMDFARLAARGLTKSSAGPVLRSQRGLAEPTDGVIGKLRRNIHRAMGETNENYTSRRCARE